MFVIDTNIKPEKIYLNSKNFSSKIDDYNKYFYQLNNTIRKYSNMDLLIKLESFIFTNTIFNINDNNNNFNYSFFSEGQGAVFNVKITNGNYNIDDLISNLNLRCVNDLNFSFNSSTLKITITSLRENQTFRLVNVLNNIYSILGFNQTISESLFNSIISPSIINLITNSSLNIVFDNIKLQCNSVKNQQINIIENIPIISSFGEIQTYINNNNFMYIIDDDNINSITINILNQDFQPVYFNNSDWYISLSVQFIYKKELKIPTDYFNVNTSFYNSLRNELIEYKKNQILSEK